jgi:hypothetical protein
MFRCSEAPAEAGSVQHTASKEALACWPVGVPYRTGQDFCDIEACPLMVSTASAVDQLLACCCGSEVSCSADHP